MTAERRPPSTALTRRDLLRGAAAVVGLGIGATVSGCSSPVLSGLTAARETAGSVDFWNLFGGGDGVRMQQMLDVLPRGQPGHRPRRRDAGLGQPVLHEALAGHGRRQAAGCGGLAPDPDEDAWSAPDLLQELRPEDLARVRHVRRQVQPAGLGGRAGRRQGVRDPARHPPVRHVLQHRRLQEGRPARRRRRAEAAGQPGRRSPTRCAGRSRSPVCTAGSSRSTTTTVHAVADLPVPLRASSAGRCSRTRAGGWSRRRQGDAGPRPSCAG